MDIFKMGMVFLIIGASLILGFSTSALLDKRVVVKEIYIPCVSYISSNGDCNSYIFSNGELHHYLNNKLIETIKMSDWRRE